MRCTTRPRIPTASLTSSSTNKFRRFTVLALESSADDTCAAVVTSNKEILSNVVIKQFREHEQFGGIHPIHAIAAHQKNMPGVVRRALDEAKLEMSDIDGVAFTRGPGIGGCLAVGGNAAKTLAAALRKPLVGVHHMQAHALTPFLTSGLTYPLDPQPKTDRPPRYPFLTLLISGGHTMILLASSPNTFKTLATTTDESIGTAFDKVSRLLKIPWGTNEGSAKSPINSENSPRSSSTELIGPGAALERLATTAPSLLSNEASTIPVFPIPMRHQLTFSYSALVSTVQRYITAHHVTFNTLDVPPPLPIASIAQAFQVAAVRQLEEKLDMAVELFRKHREQTNGWHRGYVGKGEDGEIDLIVSGGVASNAYLRSRLVEHLAPQGVRISYPPPALCTDNAAMIAWASFDRFLRNDPDPYNIELRPKWSLEDL